jgi:hypothetical protein
MVRRNDSAKQLVGVTGGDSEGVTRRALKPSLEVNERCLTRSMSRPRRPIEVPQIHRPTRPLPPSSNVNESEWLPPWLTCT